MIYLKELCTFHSDIYYSNTEFVISVVNNKEVMSIRLFMIHNFDQDLLSKHVFNIF